MICRRDILIKLHSFAIRPFLVGLLYITFKDIRSYDGLIIHLFLSDAFHGAHVNVAKRVFLRYPTPTLPIIR